MRTRTAMVLIGALILGGLAGSLITDRLQRGGVPATPWVVSAESGGDVVGQVSFLNGFAPVARRVLPAVVNIASSK